MLRKQIFICIFFAVSFNALAQIAVEDFFSPYKKNRGVKMITEDSFSKWKNTSYFNEEGLLLRKVNFFKNKIRADYRYEYSLSDTLFVIKEKEYHNLNNDKENHVIYKFYYNHLRKCYRAEVYLSRDLENPARTYVNFIYQDTLLQSYETYSFSRKEDGFNKIVYVYDSNQRVEQWHSVYGDSVFTDGCKSISIFQNEKLTDLIQICDEGGIISGEVCWNSKMNKVHIRFSTFDKRENWERSYFVTERGKVFRSKRKIEYW